MYEMFESGLRGGMCQVSHNHVKANDKYPEPYYKLAKIYYNHNDKHAAEIYLINAGIYKSRFRNKMDLAEYYLLLFLTEDLKRIFTILLMLLAY